MSRLTALGISNLLKGNSEGIIVQIIDADKKVKCKNPAYRSGMSIQTKFYLFRIIVSDSKAKHTAILADNNIISTHDAEKLKYNIIEIKKSKYQCELIIISEIKILNASIAQELGNPKDYKEQIAEQPSCSNEGDIEVSEDEKVVGEEPNKKIKVFSDVEEEEKVQSSQYIPKKSSNENSKSSIRSSLEKDDKYATIKELSIGRKYYIKARVVRKSPFEQNKDRCWFHVKLMDQDKSCIGATFYNEQAQKFFEYIQNNAVYVMKRIGVQKNSEQFKDSGENQIIVNTDYTEIEKVEDQGDHINITSIQDLNQDANYQGDCFIRATLTHIKTKEDMIFPSCQLPVSRKCHAKAKPTENIEIWQCDACGGTFKNPKYRYRLEIKLDDATGDLWAIAFNETAEILLGINAKDFMKCQQKEKNKILTAAMKKEYDFKLQVEGQFYDGKPRRQIQIIEIRN